MRPKKRVEQGQSGRLVLRNNDHRDVVYNGSYINNLFFNTGGFMSASYAYYNAKVLKQYWTKYPRKCLLVGIYNSSADRYGVGYYDIDRDVMHTAPWANSYLNVRVWRLKDFIVISSTYSSSSLYASEDGCFWEQVNSNVGSVDGFVEYDYDSNKIAYVGNTASGTSDDKIKITEYEFYRSETSGRIEARGNSRTFNLDARHTFLEHGNIVSRQGPLQFIMPTNTSLNYLLVYRVTMDSAIQIGTISPPSSAFAAYDILTSWSQMATRYNEDGSDTIVITTDFYVRNGNEYHKYLVSFASNDSGATWISTRMINNYYIGRYPDAWESIICVRKGMFYVYASQYDIRNFHLFKSVDGINWTESNLPEYIEIPFKSNGQMVSNSPGKTKARIKFRTSAPNSEESDVANYDAYTAFLLANSQRRDYLYGPNESFGGITMENGKPKRTDSWVSFRGGNTNTYFFFDNPDLNPTDDCFAIITAAPDGNSGTENIMQDDYCVKGE